MAFIKLNLNVDVNSCLSGLWASLRLGRPKTDIEKLEKEMARLRAKRDDIKKQINDEEREGKIPTSQVNQWLREVEELEGQVTDINQDFQSINCFSCNCFNRIGGTSSQTQQARDQVPIRESSNCCSINQRVVKKLGEANELMSQAGALDPIVTVGPPEPTVMLPISHRPPIGIDSFVEDIVGFIDGGKSNIIGIYGMGGVGKTTILKSIQQHYYSHRIFDHVIWVVASKDYQLKRLQMDIANSLGLKTLQEGDNELTCGEKLFQYLKNRKCLLLLDDIWEHLDLQLLGMAHSATEQGQQQQQTCKAVVFTTRSEIVCARMKAEKKMKVNCLEPEKAWQLFKENSDGDVLNSDRGINSCAQELVKECAGLPLALITVARSMLGKKSLEVWNDVLRQIRDEHEWAAIDLLEKDSVVMYKAFKLSYDSLKNDSIRECLLCCALWPEDYEIHKFERLIPHWIGCGIIREFNVINEAFAKGCYYLEVLMDASLLEHSSRGQYYYEAQHVKMHDVIRDMALLMISKLKGNGRKWIVKAENNFLTQEECQEAERALFAWNLNFSLPKYGTSTFPKLSMLILLCKQYHQLRMRRGFYARIPPSFLARMPHLTYLDISGCHIFELPMEICRLTELQYLNLSDTFIRSLPLEFGCLCKLEYLLLRYTFIDNVPNGAISNLSMLKWLDTGLIHDLWLNELKCFKGRHQLSLRIVIDPADLDKLGMLPNVSVWNLSLFGSRSGHDSFFRSSGHDSFFGSSGHHSFFRSSDGDDLGTLQWSRRVTDNLENLKISRVHGDKLTMNAGVGCESRFRCLKTLKFKEIEQVEKIRLNGVGFNNLRDLHITKCHRSKDVSWVLELPCLNLLRIKSCWEMEELISNVGNSNSSFGIKMLILIDMKKLHRIADQPLQFPFLEYIVVLYCPRLKKLPFGTEILKSRLKQIEGEQTWWDNLDWDDQSNKDSLTPYFRDLSL